MIWTILGTSRARSRLKKHSFIKIRAEREQILASTRVMEYGNEDEVDPGIMEVEENGDQSGYRRDQIDWNPNGHEAIVSENKRKDIWGVKVILGKQGRKI